jgi:ABC-type nitrate/sulfonate/bicarbonate transport system substrate-binding protein
MTYRPTRREFCKVGVAGLGTAMGLLGTGPRPARAADGLTFQANWLNNPSFAGYMIAIDKGYYSDVGLSVSYLSGGPNVIPEGSLITGKSDIALTAMASTAKAIVERGASLKIIGAQYQKSPLGVVSLEATGIKGPKDLVGKKIAVPTIDEIEFKVLVKLYDIPAESVRVVPYAFSPAPLIDGSIDASMDFVTQLPYLLEHAGKKPAFFLVYDYGLPFYADLLVVTTDTLATKRAQLVKFLSASRKGWHENYVDPEKYPPLYHETWFKGAGSTIGAETYYNTMQKALMDHPNGFFALSADAIDRNIEALGRLGVNARRDMFDSSVLAEL